MLKEGTQEFLDGVTVDDIRQKSNAQIFIVQNCYIFDEILAIINYF
jgi:hypothetical protein